MNHRLSLLLTVVIGAIVLSYLEYAFFSMLGGTRAVFLQLAVLGVAAAIGTVVARNLVHAALYLVAFFFLVACIFLVLEAEFLAAMQVLVYIGAVAVLMMFGIMLTRNIQGDDTTSTPWPRKVFPGMVAGGLFLVLVYGIVNQRPSELGADPERPGVVAWNERVHRPDSGPANALKPRGVVIGDMPRTLGNELMSRWAVPFEVAGLLLTAALVGAVALARVDEPEKPLAGSVAQRERTELPSGNGDHAKPAPLAQVH